MRSVVNSTIGFMAMVVISLLVDKFIAAGYSFALMAFGVALVSASSQLVQLKQLNGGKKPCPYMGIDAEVLLRLSDEVRLPTAIGFAVAGSMMLFNEIVTSVSETPITVSSLVFAVAVGVAMGFVSLIASAASVYVVARRRVKLAQSEILRNLKENLQPSDNANGD